MSNNPTQQPSPEQFLVQHRADILAILQAMAVSKVATAITFSDRAGTVDSRLLSLKPHYEELVFDGSGIGNLVFAEGQTHVTVEAHYDYLHVRFEASHIEADTWQGKPAFRACIPKTIVRAQRRTSMRFPVPSDRPPVVSWRTGNAQDGEELRLRVFDMSFGGVSLVLQDRRIPIATGEMLSDCRLELPQLGAVSLDLQVAYVDEMSRESGWRRAGCRFSGLSLLALERVRDYVLSLEREHLRTAG